MMENEVMVSVVMLTFQHYSFIGQAIESILMQEVNFTYEIVIGDDYSTDGTQDILLSYKEKYPDKINLILNKKNMGAMKNAVNVLEKCKGKYVAYLEGDDFWNDKDKLQMQVDFLENNSEYAACYHNIFVIGNNMKACRFYRAANYDIEEFGTYFKMIPTIPTASIVSVNFFKNKSNLNYYKRTSIIGDRIMHALILRYGKIKYIDKKMSTYRFITNGNSSYSSMDYLIRIKDYINAVKVQRDIAPYEYNELITKHLIESYYKLVRNCMEKRKYKDLLVYWVRDLNVSERKSLAVYTMKDLMKRAGTFND